MRTYKELENENKLYKDIVKKQNKLLEILMKRVKELTYERNNINGHIQNN